MSDDSAIGFLVFILFVLIAIAWIGSCAEGKRIGRCDVRLEMARTAADTLVLYHGQDHCTP